MGKLFQIINASLSGQSQIPLFYPVDIPDGALVLALEQDDVWTNILYCGEIFIIQSQYLATCQ